MNRGKTGYLIVGVLACIVVGAGLERVRQAVMAPIVVTEPLPELPRLSRVAQTGAASDDASIRAALDTLHKRVAGLEKALAARDAELAALKQNKPTDVASSRMPRREEFRQRMEQLKKEHPEQYAEMEKRREEFHQRMEQEKQDRADFLSSIGTQSMSEAQKANHEKLLETLAKIEALRAQREQSKAEPGEPGSEVDLAAHQAMGETMAELGVLYDQERTYLLEQAAYAAGYEGSDAVKFVDYIQETVQSTTMQGPGGPGGGPPPGM